MNGSITSPSQVTTQNTMMMIGCLVFINMNMDLSWHLNSEIYVLELPMRRPGDISYCEWHHGADFLTDSAQLTLVCCMVDKN